MPPRAPPRNPLCGNPLLLDFLEEWYQESVGTGSKAEQIYRKACDSMRACPLTFSHPSETICLKGIGEKIAKKLVERLIAYHQERGETPPPMVPYIKPAAPPPPPIAKTKTTQTSKVVAQDVEPYEMSEEALALLPVETRAIVIQALAAAKEKAQANGTSNSTNTRKRPSTGFEIDNNVDTIDAETPPPKKARKPRAKQPSADHDSDNNIDESDVTAQPAKKGKQPKGPKQYVPRPRTGGYAILRALTELDDDANLTKDELIRAAQPYSDSSFTVSSNAGGGPINYTAWGTVKTLKDHNLIKQQGRPARYSLTDHGRETGEKMLEVEAELGQQGVGTGAAAAGVKSSTLQKTKAPSPAAAYDFESVTIASASQVGRLFANQAGNSLFLEDGDEDSDGNKFVTPNLEQDFIQSRNENIMPGIMAQHKSALGVASAPTEISDEPLISYPNSDHFKSLRTSKNEAHNIIFKPFPKKYLKAGTFTINLILDNREVAMKSDRDYLQRQLSEIDCTPITRALELGDVMWIAKGKLTNEHGIQTQEMVEIALGHVAERKRLDDLVGSIKDGRFHEQKFRLQKFIENVTYLIETPANAIGKHPYMAEAITSAIFSTQVVNDFFVKISPKLDDTIRYLARYTSLLASIFSSQDLYLIPETHVFSRNFSELRSHLKSSDPTRNYYLSYAGLGSLANKSKTMTLRDTFLKMLMCTRGVSAEKALEIQRVFKTPKDLIDSFRQVRSKGGSEEAKKMVMLKVDPGAKTDRKKIKAALSAKIYDVWGKQ